MKRAFYVGRFQPFHYGHEKILNTIAEEVDEVVIGIGSAQKSHSTRDPFTAGERVEMVLKSLENFPIRHYIIPLQDVEYNALWVPHVKSMSPKFDVAYSNNPLVIQLFTEAGIEVRRPAMHERSIYSGTAIRKSMIESKNREWTEYVPPTVAEVIDEVGGICRIKRVSGNDE
ncbi:Bifunctional NMN adenylyltransferase/Nudix hydrolase [Methanimicrococcus stummii]|uniref:Nicotinamide-nucleotide adenylyltransferase n=1 Tax=Methanimicrococcus stummii TaxID=3028294 RepID=A0AA96VAC7_9EURY|nr:nicotinamide-nucleotide adenylyltransferase [Methanimicrococcus sp. Es2]WNY28620.1 Bifunctional NMN adenylyltransferase/Nudix hydrolase [Methanimicrococcus sp. Es2]